MAEILSQTQTASDAPGDTLKTIRSGLTRRHARERRFRAYGIAAICAALGAVLILFSMILAKGIPAFTTLRGGAYFFLPGMNAMRYLASLGD